MADGHYLNERYLHHCFSRELQTYTNYRIDYSVDRKDNNFHPEWTTKGKYKEGKPNENGTTGNIDFVLGRCDDNSDLKYGIEFKHSQGWNVKALRFDYMKLLDKENKIDRAISFAVIFRKTELSDSERRKAINSLKQELGDRLAVDRQFLFVIVQVAPGVKTDNIRSWYCNNLTDGFQLSTPLEDPLEKAWFKE